MTKRLAGLALRRLAGLARRRRLAAGVVLLAVIAVCCFAGPAVYHSDQLTTHLAAANLPPGRGHPLGTDDNGYDIAGRLLAGGRATLEIALGVAVAATVLGAAWGALAGYAGGAADAAMMRVADIGLAIPVIFVLIFLSTVTRPSVPVLTGVLTLVSWLGPARLARAEVLSLRTRPFVQAARAAGAGRWRIITRHLIPGTAGTLAVSATFQVADAIVALSTLSFLGFGLPPPAVTWGGMLSQGTSYLLDGYWWQVYPAGLAIVATVMAANLAGDGMPAVFTRG